MSKENSKSRLHPRNRNKERYDLAELIKVQPALGRFVVRTKTGSDTIDFSIPQAVKELNTAILKHYYDIEYWQFPEGHLCPPIPGRADYLHYVADWLGSENNKKTPLGDKITCFDVGVGASAIYPIIGISEYDWNFVASDVSIESIRSAENIINQNKKLNGKATFKYQQKKKAIFFGMIDDEDHYDITICNPPFHASLEEAQKGTRRKIRNLSGENRKNPPLNFDGNTNELIYPGGEYNFIRNMIRESKFKKDNCLWFSTLVSKKSNLKGVYTLLSRSQAEHVETIEMGTGNKISRIVLWTYQTKEQRANWIKERWS